MNNFVCVLNWQITVLLAIGTIVVGLIWLRSRKELARAEAKECDSLGDPERKGAEIDSIRAKFYLSGIAAVIFFCWTMAAVVHFIWF
ncbi:MAG: hypothetical protein WC582_04615 [Patescibacteria group bacterium]